MQILWKWLGQKPNLSDWESRAFSPGLDEGPAPGDNQDVHVREVTKETPGEPQPGGPHRRLADALLNFQVFPPRLATGVLSRRPVDVADTVGLCYHLFPGIDLFFAARVTARFDEKSGGIWRTGFAYRTLQGHPMAGEEAFSIEKDLASGRVLVALRSWSRPQILLARVASPLVRCLQLNAGRAALDCAVGHLLSGP